MPAFHLPLAAAYVVITAITATIWSLLTWHIRLFIRRKIHGPFRADDIHCTIATVSAVLQSSLTIAQTTYGLGRHVDALQQRSEDKQHLLGWIGALFFVVALGESMLSVCFLIERVTKRTQQARIAYFIAGGTVLWMVVSVLVISFQCKMPTPWITRPRTRCIGIYKIWLGITISRCLLEFANMIAAVVLLSSVRMPWKPKAVVLAAFSIRLLVIPPSLTRLKYLKETLHSSDWSYSRIDVLIITQVTMHISIILATVPCIRPWLIAFESGGLQAPADVRRVSHKPNVMAPKLAPLLPIAMPPPAFDQTSESRESPGQRNRVPDWPGEVWSGHVVENKTVTTIEHDPAEAREMEMARKKSQDSQSSRGITRTTSFSVKFEDIAEQNKDIAELDIAERLPEPPQPAPTTSRPVRPNQLVRRTTSYNSRIPFWDASGLLEENPRARLKSRTGSVISV